MIQGTLQQTKAINGLQMQLSPMGKWVNYMQLNGGLNYTTCEGTPFLFSECIQTMCQMDNEWTQCSPVMGGGGHYKLPAVVMCLNYLLNTEFLFKEKSSESFVLVVECLLKCVVLHHVLLKQSG